ncbi:SIR2 family protein [Sphingomonas carotinifaciens]|uniref:SIR2 family protein n=1 Tax=Sphingomonas carotinifaciens TaxID=1166323 RepID=UPI000DD68CD8|nr:SIR2 family protein [Sphingomonas carotinifaciens]
MIEWQPEIVGDLARRRAVLVIGSGISRHSEGEAGKRPPTWKEFLEQAVIDCPDKSNLEPVRLALDANDYLHACEWLKKRFDEAWPGYLRTTFSRPAFKSAAIHEQILKLDSRIVFSLNFDDIYERHASDIHRGSHIVKNYYDADVAEFLRGDLRYIIKVHGNLNSAPTLIFTQNDYSRARVKYATFYQAFDAALLTHTFVFIGCGFADPDVNLLLENQNFGFPAQSPHYFVTAHNFSHDRKQSLRDNRNLKVLEYDPLDAEHSGLVRELAALNDLVDSARYDIGRTASW